MKAKRIDWDSVDLAAAYSRYRAGESLTLLARELGASSDAMRKAFIARGLAMKIHARNMRMTDKRVRELHARYNGGGVGRDDRGRCGGLSGGDPGTVPAPGASVHAP